MSHNTETGEMVERAAKSLGPPAIAQMPPEIAEAIFKVRAGIKQLGFDERNEHSKYPYASVDKFYAALRPLETEAGLQVILDEVGLDVRAGDTGKGWAFIDYEIWLMHKTGVMWGPLRRHVALPVTGAQTFGAAESYIHKAFCRGFYRIPTGEKDADAEAQVESVPVRPPTWSPAPGAGIADVPAPAAPSHTPSSTGEEKLSEIRDRIHRALQSSNEKLTPDTILKINKADLELIKRGSLKTHAALVAYAEERNFALGLKVPAVDSFMDATDAETILRN